MVEQVWKNVVGDMFPYVVLGDSVVLTVPQGSTVRLYDLGLLVEKAEKALDKYSVITGGLNDSGLLELTITFNSYTVIEEEPVAEQEEELEEPVEKRSKVKK